MLIRGRIKSLQEPLYTPTVVKEKKDIGKSPTIVVRRMRSVRPRVFCKRKTSDSGQKEELELKTSMINI